MTKWPRDNQADLIAFYGTPGPDVERQLVNVVPPFRMTYEGAPIKAIRFHRKAAAALEAALREIWDHYGHDQKRIDALGISKYAGTYNPRKVRGSATKWSNHAFGAAIDLNAAENGFGAGHGTMPQPVIDAFKRQGARWGGDYRGRTDPMHFEFCDATGYPGVARPVALVDAPQVDGDGDQGGDDSTDFSAQRKPTFLKRALQWLGAGGSLSFLGYLTSWQVVAILCGFSLIVSGLIVWFFGAANVRAWVARQVS
ncbi:M15 family metallopeptidase [Mesorhizobium sp.]|uniref:M15 family metallopeptidase n=1 Tax=Mesorhizobium sp. TaxID=1871066 RepID=UPI0025FB0FD8|nr:M15 family metallopeptidase [Mesorhizobium sp.]